MIEPVLQSLSLEGTVAIVTGGGSGLGREMALALARAGADVVLAARRPKPIESVADEIRAIGPRALAQPTDVTDAGQVGRLVETTVRQFGRVDVLVNNAGMVGGQGGKPIWDITDEEWRTVLDANLSGAFYCARAVARHMVERGSGKIVNVSSGFGLRGGRDNYMYACSKGGVIQLTRALATSLGRYGITSNCIVPGFFPTEGTEASHESLPTAKFVPLGRVGDPREVGPVAVFLASRASDYMNGEMFVIDGGGLAGGYAPTGHAPVIPLEE
jgi:NAD(P)-dependent dehydrogenase (short-subunit alcohol dehydrogenase family)